MWNPFKRVIRAEEDDVLKPSHTVLDGKMHHKLIVYVPERILSKSKMEEMIKIIEEAYSTSFPEMENIIILPSKDVKRHILHFISFRD